MSNQQSEETQLAVIGRDVEYLRKTLDEFRADVKEWKKNFVTKDEFKPVRILTYGAAGIILTTAIIAVLSVIIR